MFKNWGRPEVSIIGADQKNRGLWGREWRRYYICSLFWFSVSSLECNFCYSTTSWEDCNATKIECPPSDDQCIKLHMKAGEQGLYLKSCSSRLACKSAENPICKQGAGSGITCDISCCNDKDNCNAGSAFRISGSLLLACVLASFVVSTAWRKCWEEFSVLMWS